MKTAPILVLLCAIGILAAQTAPASKNYEKLKKQHLDWAPCVIYIGKDTVYARIKYKDDYSTPDGFNGKGITIAYKDETEAKLKPGQYSAFIVGYENHIAGMENSERTKYLSVLDGGSYGLYRVVVDGKCPLLYCDAPGTSLPAPGSRDGGFYSSNAKYFVYYKGQLTRVNTVAGFKSTCKEVFADCPSLVEKIDNKVYTSNDLAKIVTEFNQCLDGKSASGGQKN